MIPAAATVERMARTRAGEKIRLDPCAFADVKGWAKVAAKERVSIKPTPDTAWFWIRAGGHPGPRGLCGLYFHRGIARIKGVLVFDAMRGRGFGEAAVDALEAVAQEAGCSAVEAFAWNEAFYVRRGYRLVTRNAHGAGRMVKSL